MKKAISISDELFETVEQFVQARGVSRSELSATALGQYVRERRSEVIAERFNAI